MLLISDFCSDFPSSASAEALALSSAADSALTGRVGLALSRKPSLRVSLLSAALEVSASRGAHQGAGTALAVSPATCLLSCGSVTAAVQAGRAQGWSRVFWGQGSASETKISSHCVNLGWTCRPFECALRMTWP